MKAKIRFLVLDVDGTLTDGKIYMAESGELFKTFDIKDGYGICNILPELNICLLYTSFSVAGRPFVSRGYL